MRDVPYDEPRVPSCLAPQGGRRGGCLPLLPLPRASDGSAGQGQPGAVGLLSALAQPAAAPPAPPKQASAPASSGGRVWDHRFQQTPPCRQHGTALPSTRSSNPECVRTYLRPTSIPPCETQRFVLLKAGGDLKIHLSDQERSQAIGCRSTPWIFRKEQR